MVTRWDLKPHSLEKGGVDEVSQNQAFFLLEVLCNIGQDRGTTEDRCKTSVELIRGQELGCLLLWGD